MQPIEYDVLLQEPIPYRVVWKDGTKETFLLPRLGVDGLIPWLAELTEERRAVSRAVVSKMKLGAMDAMRAEKSIILNDVAVINDLVGPIQQGPGIPRVIRLSLAHANARLYSRTAADGTTAIVDEPITPQRQAQILASIMATAYVANSIAQRVSTLFYLDGEAELAREAQPAPPANGGFAGPLADPGTAPGAVSESPTTG